MEKKYSGMVEFFEKVLPKAEFGKHWDQESISRAISWGRICQKMYATLTTDLCSSQSSPAFFCVCTGAVIQESDNDNPINPKHRKSFGLSANDSEIDLSICKTCRLKKHHKKVTDGTLKSKSVWQKRELTSSLMLVLKGLGYNFYQMEDAVLMLLSKLLLNKVLSIEQQALVRGAVEKELKEEEIKNLWLLVDQVKVNQDHLKVLLDSSGEGCYGGILLQEEFKSSLEHCARHNQLDAWMKDCLSSDRLQLDVSSAQINEGGYSLRVPNFLYRLLSVVVSSEDDVGLNVLKWLTLVHRDDTHECHALLLNQWLSLFWFRHKMSTAFINVDKKIGLTTFEQQLEAPNFSLASFNSDAVSLKSFGNTATSENCFCKVVAILLPSLLTALFESCSVGLQANDDNLEPKWVLKGTNSKAESPLVSVTRIIHVSGVAAPSLLNVDNLTCFVHSLVNCGATDHYSSCTGASFKSVYCDQETKRPKNKGISHHHAKILATLRKALTLYGCSPQGSLWADVMLKTFQVNSF